MRRGWEEVALDGIAEAQYNMNLTHIQVCSIPLLDQLSRTVPVDAPWEAPNAAVWDGQTLETWLDAVKAHARGFASSRLTSLSRWESNSSGTRSASPGLSRTRWLAPRMRSSTIGGCG
jgi:hypothetical protein